MKLKVLAEEADTKKKEEPKVVIDSTIHGAEPAPYVDAVANSEKNKQAVAATVASIAPKEVVTGTAEKDTKVPVSDDLKAMKLESLTTDANKDKRIIHTGLTHQLDKEVLDSVLGQMSDGIWENSPSMEKYWGCVDFDMIDGEVCIVITTNNSFGCGFRDMDDDDVKKYFATKIKQVVKEEINDGANIEWVRNSKQHLDYMHSAVTVGDCYRVYDALLERQNRSESPDNIIVKEVQELKAGDKTEDGKVVKSVEAKKTIKGPDSYWIVVTYEDGTTEELGKSSRVRLLKEAVTEAKEEDEVKVEEPKVEEPKVEVKVEEPNIDMTVTPALPGPQTEQAVGVASMLNEDIIGEWRTIDIYHSHIASINALLERREMDEKTGNAIKDILTDITNEENIHIGQLQKALSLISPNVNSITTGEKEAKEKIAEIKPAEVKPEAKVEESTKENK